MKKPILFVFVLLLSALFAQSQTPQKLTGTTIGTASANERALVFDGNLNNGHSAGVAAGGWVGLDLGEGKKFVITKVGYCPRPNQEEKRVQLGVFEGANSPNFFDAVPLFLIPESSPKNTLTYADVNVSRAFRYVRYMGTDGTWCDIGELEFYGYEAQGSESHFYTVTNIPTVTIHTENNAKITSKTTYINASVSFIEPSGYIYTDSTQIRGRGNASWDQFPKKPYRLKLFNSTHVMGFPAKAKNWTLISNHGDKTLIRNLIAFDISKRFEMPYTPAGRCVDLLLNGEYVGTYQLCDQIDIRKNRVDIDEMDMDDAAGDSITGGYLIEMDAYADNEPDKRIIFKSTNRQVPVTMKNPDDADWANFPAMRSYISNHFATMETVLFGANWRDPVNGYTRYIDTASFCKHFLVGELSGNTDTYWSVYLYKKRNDDKFYWAPIWDYDLAFENDSRTHPIIQNTLNRGNQWLFQWGGNDAHNVDGMINRIISDPDLYLRLKETWAWYRDELTVTPDSMTAVINRLGTEAYDSQDLNFKRWNIRNEWVHQMWGRSTTYQGDLDIVDTYLKQRIAWMDTKLSYVPNPHTPPENLQNASLSTVKVFAGKGSIQIEGMQRPSQIRLYNAAGKQLSLHETAQSNLTIAASQPGIYIVTIATRYATKSFKCVVE